MHCSGCSTPFTPLRLPNLWYCFSFSSDIVCFISIEMKLFLFESHPKQNRRARICWHRVDVVFSCFPVQPYFDFESTYLSIELFCTQWRRIFLVRYKETGRWEEWQRKKINWSDIKSAMGVTARNHLDWFLIIKKKQKQKSIFWSFI